MRNFFKFYYLITLCFCKFYIMKNMYICNCKTSLKNFTFLPSRNLTLPSITVLLSAMPQDTLSLTLSSHRRTTQLITARKIAGNWATVARRRQQWNISAPDGNCTNLVCQCPVTATCIIVSICKRNVKWANCTVLVCWKRKTNVFFLFSKKTSVLTWM